MGSRSTPRTATFAKGELLLYSLDLSLFRPVRDAQRVDYAFGRGLHLVVGERPLGIAVRETQRQADAPLRNALALIAIELRDRHEGGRGRRTDSATNRRCRQGFIDHNRDVADDGWVTWKRLRPQVIAGGDASQRFQIEFCDVHVLSRDESARLCDRRRELSELAELCRSREYMGSAPLHEIAHVMRSEIETLHAEDVAQQFDRSFRIEE